MGNTFNVYKGSKLIDTVFYSDGVQVDCQEVKQSLVGHDGYDPDIRVVKRRAARRKMKTEYQIHGLYAHGWEEVTAEDSFEQARERLKEYRENESGTAFKMKRVRVPA